MAEKIVILPGGTVYVEKSERATSLPNGTVYIETVTAAPPSGGAVVLRRRIQGY